MGRVETGDRPKAQATNAETRGASECDEEIGSAQRVEAAPPTLAPPCSEVALVRTALAMIAFAANSLLCRIALGHTQIDPASFTTIRIASGALVLALIVQLRGSASGAPGPAPTASLRDVGSWPSALALFVYAAAFSFAYTRLTTATGALLLFGAVQATMIGRGLLAGERLSGQQTLGLAAALAGLVGLLLPGLSAPPLASAATMLVAGVAWGIYSLRGRSGGDPTRVSAGNFLRATPIALGLSLLSLDAFSLDRAGTLAAIASGALASGLGYVIWYGVLPVLGATRAAVVQLSVPVLAAIGGIVLLGEAPTLRLALASIAILGGIALVIGAGARRARAPGDRSRNAHRDGEVASEEQRHA